MNARRDLVGFQRRLVERLDAASSRQVEPARLALESGGEGWLLELADARELIPVPALTPVPMTQPWFRGVVGIRGELFGVMDFAAFRGLDATPLNLESRILIPHGRFGANAALLFTRSLGLKAARSFEFEPGEGSARDATGRWWRNLFLEDVLAGSRFLDIAA